MSSESTGNDTLSQVMENSLSLSNEDTKTSQNDDLLVVNSNNENLDANGKSNALSIENAEPYDVFEESDASDCEYDLTDNDDRPYSPGSRSNQSKFDDSSESDWEGNTCDQPKNFEKIYMHPTKSEQPAFVPSDLHVSLISSHMEIWHTVADGQFDDADL